MSIVELKYDYQREMYEEIKELINSGETSLCYVLCMGLGKSYIFLKILEDYFPGKRVLYVSPKRAINLSFATKPEFVELKKLVKIDMVTFTMFNKERPNYIDYDGLFIDEVHHGISPVQGKNVMKLKADMNSKGKLVCGFSATPVFKNIYTNQYTDIRSMFNRAVTGITISEAIRKGLLPKIKYAVAVPDIEQLMNDTGWTPKDFRLKYSVDSTKSMLENIITENDEIHHWLAFFSNEKNMQEGYDQLKTIFPDYTIYMLYQKTKSTIQHVMQQFDQNPGKCILITINMLLEGIHPTTCEGILLYRKPREMVFTQIMGRLMNIDFKERQPLFVDVMNIGTQLDLQRYLEYTTDIDYIGYTNERGDSNLTDSLRDIIDVNCSSYRYVQMLEDILRVSEYNRSMHVVVNGFEYTFRSYYDLAKQLGITTAKKDSGKWSANFKSKLADGWSLEDVCYYYLSMDTTWKKTKTDTIKEVDNTERTIKYKGPSDLHRILTNDFDMSVSLCSCWKYLTNGMTPQEIYDLLVFQKKYMSKKSGSVTVNGEIISYTSYKDLSHKLGFGSEYVSKKLHSGKTLDEIIAKIEKRAVEIDGKVYRFATDTELARILGVSSNVIVKNKAKGETYESIIRKYTTPTTRSVVIDGEEFQFKNYTQVSLKLGKSPQYIYNVMHRTHQTCQEIVDNVVNNKTKYQPPAITSVTSITVDGELYEFSTDAQLSGILGYSPTYVSYYRNRRSMSYEDIIRHAKNTKMSQ